MPQFSLMVDARQHSVEADDDTPLLYILRDKLALKGPKFGCGLAQCGACTVIVDGIATRSCILPVAAASSTSIRTLDGLEQNGQRHPVQMAFIAEEAAQCGYCSNGWIMTTVAALERNPVLSDAEIRTMLGDLKCRCGAHMAILRAVRRAADDMQAAGSTAGVKEKEA